MKKRRYKVQTQYIFEGVFEVLAGSEAEARERVLRHCGLVMGEGVHSSLPDEEVCWCFPTHPELRLRKATLLRD